MDDYGFHPSAAIVCDVSTESEGVEKLIREGIGMKRLRGKSDRNEMGANPFRILRKL